MADNLSQSDKLASLSAKVSELLGESAQLRAALVRNMQESRRLVEQLDELRASLPLGNNDLRGMRLQDLEDAALLTALETAEGNRTHAAKMLGISVRTIQRKLKTMGWLADEPGRNGQAVNQRAS